MKIGSTVNLIVQCDSGFDITSVDSIIFTLQTNFKSISKEYKADGSGIVNFDSENYYFVIPVYQKDTIELSNGEAMLCQVEGQINYTDNSVKKTSIDAVRMVATLSTSLITDNAPSDNQKELLNITIY